MSESNGQPPHLSGVIDPAERDRQALRAARVKQRLLETQLRVTQLEHAREAIAPTDGGPAGKRWQEASQLFESWNNSEWLASYSEMLDRFTGEPSQFNIASYWDRKQGKNWPIFQTEQQLAILRLQSRILNATNSYAIGLMEGLTSYVVGEGCTPRAVADDMDLADAVQKIIDRHLDYNDWHGGEQPGLEEELFQRSCEDGETFVDHCPVENGLTALRTVEPEQVTQKPGGTWEEWSFGINADPEDSQTRYGIWIFWGNNPADGEEYPTDRVLHFRRNVKRSIKRGQTDFCFDAHDALSLASKLRKAMTVGGAVQASIAGVRQYTNANQASVVNLQTNQEDYNKVDQLTGKQRSVQRLTPGRWVDIPAGMQFLPSPAYSNSQIFVDILHASLRGAGVRWNAPEWLATASGAEMAAYTASLTAESPFVRTVQRKQKPFAGFIRCSIWIAITNYVNWLGGSLVVQRKKTRDDGSVAVGEERFTLADIKRLVKVVVEMSSPAVRDAFQEAQANQIRVQGGWKSRQMCAQEEGNRWEDVAADIEEYNDTFGSAGLPLGLPGDGLPGTAGGAG